MTEQISSEFLRSTEVVRGLVEISHSKITSLSTLASRDFQDLREKLEQDKVEEVASVSPSLEKFVKSYLPIAIKYS